MNELIGRHLTDRAEWIMNKIEPFLSLHSCPELNLKDYRGKFFVAGGCMMPAEPNDVDLFVCEGHEPPACKAEVISRTANATTYATEPWPLQVCRYSAKTLPELLESFDFSFNQVGAEFEATPYLLQCTAVHCTDAYVATIATGRAQFMGTKYPLSSLIRVQKYFKSGRMPRPDAIGCMLQILVEVIGRGFSDYGDFKDQLDAVDLELVEEDMRDSHASLQELFKLLRKDSDADVPPVC